MSNCYIRIGSKTEPNSIHYHWSKTGCCDKCCSTHHVHTGDIVFEPVYWQLINDWSLIQVCRMWRI
jgi:hypothetical protein